MSTPESKSIICPGCNAELEIDGEYFAELAGTAIECPECEAEVQIPAPAPAAEPEAPAKKKLSVKGKAPAAAPGGGGDSDRLCPECGSGVAEDAVICVNCGTNLTSGKKHADGVAKSRPREKMSKGRMVVGVISVLVIVGAGANAYLNVRGKKVTQQSKLVMFATRGEVGSQNYDLTVKRLEQALEKAPLATNRQDAVNALNTARDELEKVPARTVALETAIQSAQQADTRAEKMDILSKAMMDNPGATNMEQAKNMLENVRRSN